MQQKIIFSFLGALCLLVVSGCGGVSPTANAPETSRARIAALLQQIAGRSSQLKQTIESSGNTSGSQTRAKARRVTRSEHPEDDHEGHGGEGHESEGGSEEFTVGSIVSFGEELWARVDVAEYGDLFWNPGQRGLTKLERTLFLDAEATKPAGFTTMRNQSTTNLISIFNELRITAGSLKGMYYQVENTNNRTEGIYSYRSEGKTIAPNENGVLETSVYRIMSETLSGKTTYTSEYTTNGVTYGTRGTYNQDGSSESTWTTNAGYTITWRIKADQTGSFTISNPSDSLTPANGVFDAEGNGTITFADGTTAPFNLYESNFYR